MSLTSIDYNTLDNLNSDSDNSDYTDEYMARDTLVLYAVHDLIYVSDKLRNLEHRDLADNIDRIVSTLR